MAPCMSEGTQSAFRELRDYAGRIERPAGSISEREVHTASAMLISALFADAMGREMMPQIYPAQARAPRLYSRLLLNAIGFKTRNGGTR